MMASQFNENARAIELLLEAGAEVNVQDKDGTTPLWLAVAFNKNPEVVSLLLEHGADANLASNNGGLPLTFIHFGDENALKVLNFLLEAGADVNADDSIFGTPLMRASAQAAMDAIERLLEAGADVSGTDKYGQTALMSAAYNNYPLVIERLIEAGADVFKEDDRGRTAFNYALEEDAQAALETLMASSSFSLDASSIAGNYGFTDSEGTAVLEIADDNTFFLTQERLSYGQSQIESYAGTYRIRQNLVTLILPDGRAFRLTFIGKNQFFDQEGDIWIRQ